MPSTWARAWGTVLDLVRSFEKASGKPLPYKVGPRRAGDLDAYWADATLAQDLLGWTVQSDLDAMCADTWNWQTNNPNGYKGEQ